MLKEVIREFANSAADKAKLILERDGSIVPVLLRIGKDNRVNPTMVEDVKEVPSLLIEASKECQAIVFIFDSRIKLLGKDEKPPESLEDLKDTTQTLCVFIYHPEGTESKKITYAKNNVSYTFFDLGWTSVTLDDGLFNNPFCQ